MRVFLASALAGFLTAGTALAAPVLSDLAVFSSNAEGGAYGGLLWNTRGKPEDVPDRYNIYVSESADPSAPVFVNGFNDDRTRIALSLAPGTSTFLLFAESTGAAPDPAFSFALNLFFGNSDQPAISVLAGPDCVGVCAATAGNGSDIFGNGLQAAAGTAETVTGGNRVRVTGFSWAYRDSTDTVWTGWANDAPYSGGSGVPDYVGSLTLQVAPVPLPAALWLLGAALLGLIGLRKSVQTPGTGTIS